MLSILSSMLNFRNMIRKGEKAKNGAIAITSQFLGGNVYKQEKSIDDTKAPKNLQNSINFENPSFLHYIPISGYTVMHSIKDTADFPRINEFNPIEGIFLIGICLFTHFKPD